MGHLAGDFLLQTAWMAQGKPRHLLPLVVHALVYTLAIALFSLPAGGLGLRALAVLYLSHALLDQRGFVRWWVNMVNGRSSPEWMAVVVDQSWHLLVLAFIPYLS